MKYSFGYWEAAQSVDTGYLGSCASFGALWSLVLGLVDQNTGYRGFAVSIDTHKYVSILSFEFEQCIR